MLVLVLLNWVVLVAHQEGGVVGGVRRLLVEVERVGWRSGGILGIHGEIDKQTGVNARI